MQKDRTEVRFKIFQFKKVKLFFILIVTTFGLTIKSTAQKYGLYSNDSLLLQSNYLQETIKLNLHFPETYNFSADSTHYPITIIFDSQNEQTYSHILNSFDLLTNETQIPETIIIGIPFNFENRLYLTSNHKKENDSLSGIERMELFLFSELIPKLQKEHKANHFISIIGHSRTGYLVNYLSFKRAKEINIAISLSGFYSEPPLSITKFSNFLLDSTNFPNRFSYYCSVGNTLEESTYLEEYQKLLVKTSPSKLPKNLKMQGRENQYSNHITNYWLSVPPILIDAFSEYNSILDNWFYNRLKKEKMKNPVELFKKDLEIASEKIGMELKPSLTHIFSLASHFGYQNKEYKIAFEFLDLGLRYYPSYLEFYQEIIEYHRKLNQQEKVNYYKQILCDKTLSNQFISEFKRNELLEYLDE